MLHPDLSPESYADIIANNLDCLLTSTLASRLLSFVFTGHCCIRDFEIFWGVISVTWRIEELVLWGSQAEEYVGGSF